VASYVVVFVMVSDEKEATKIVHNLLNDRLIACANIVGPVSSSILVERKN
jgi:uncharacterized protein involved in tolerance to divalent cations